MSVAKSEQKPKFSNSIINLQDRYSGHAGNIMDVRARKIPPSVIGQRKVEYHRSLSQGGARRLIPAKASYFSLESLLLLTCLTASLLILPLILPPLPPPPLMLLLLPIAIFVVLMLLAFMPTNVKDVTHTYV
ncbi:hypothetical protein SLEP1_g18106 [Rubroshorea leprosula]|uniref:ARGOS-like protein n=1 Tax=Rubroshorea leprosula TaxID=152421 RepID=A0AAV5J2A0_9ROSI|nr:hypothetical protein SLEP1_g18106 [Rubroshorea leprosula]